MQNRLYIDDNIFLFNVEDDVFIQVKQNEYMIISKLTSYEFHDPEVHLYFEDHISLRIKKINNIVSEYQLLLNIITYKDYIKRNFLSYKYDKQGSKIVYEIWSMLMLPKNEIKSVNV